MIYIQCPLWNSNPEPFCSRDARNVNHTELPGFSPKFPFIVVVEGLYEDAGSGAPHHPKDQHRYTADSLEKGPVLHVNKLSAIMGNHHQQHLRKNTTT